MSAEVRDAVKSIAPRKFAQNGTVWKNNVVESRRSSAQTIPRLQNTSVKIERKCRESIRVDTANETHQVSELTSRNETSRSTRSGNAVVKSAQDEHVGSQHAKVRRPGMSAQTRRRHSQSLQPIVECLTATCKRRESICASKRSEMHQIEQAGACAKKIIAPSEPAHATCAVTL